MRHLRVAFVAVLALSGCAGAAAPAAPATVTVTVTQTVTATVEPAPTPTTLTMEQAGERYLEIVADWNASLGEWDTAVQAVNDGTSEWTRLRDLAATRGVMLRQMTDDLVATVWPEEVADLVDTLVTEWSAETGVWVNAGKATNEASFQDSLSSLPATSSAQELRVRLGLSNVGEG